MALSYQLYTSWLGLHVHCLCITHFYLIKHLTLFLVIGGSREELQFF
jgi:hypothetical protein